MGVPPRSRSSLSRPNRLEPPAASTITEGAPTLTLMPGVYPGGRRSRTPGTVPAEGSRMDLLRDAAAVVGGAADKMRKENLFQTGRFFLDVYVLAPGQSQAPHAHAGSDKVYAV